MKILCFLVFGIVLNACSPNDTQSETLASDQSSIEFCEDEKLDSLFQSNQTDCSRLIEAAKNNDFETAKKLIEGGVDVNCKIQLGNDSWANPLRYGIHHESLKMAELLLKNGADPNIDLGRSLSPFHYSSGTSPTSFNLLLENGGNIKTLNIKSDYPSLLIWAVSQGQLKNTKLLIDRGVSIEPDSMNNFESPLNTAIRSTQIEIVKLLISNGANVNAIFSEDGEDCMPCPYGITVMHYLVRVHSYANTKESQELILLILKNKPDLNIEDLSGATPLEHAMYFSKDIDLVNLLLANGAKLETEDLSSIHCAATFSNSVMVEFLLKKGVNPNLQDQMGNTALMHSYLCCGDGFGERITTEERIKTIELLLEHGADPTIKNKEGKSFVDICKEGHRKEINDLMVKRGLLKEMNDSKIN